MRNDKLLLLYVLFSFVFLVGTSYGQSVFNLTLTMTGSNQVPSVTTNGYGFGWGMLDLNNRKLTYAVTYDSLSGPPTAAHFHLGADGVNGSPIHTISFDANGVAAGEWTNINDTTLAHILHGRVYCNIHTSSHPNGEIRGQLLYNGPFTFRIFATGTNEVPPVSENGKVVGFALLTSNVLSVYGVYKGLSGPPTGMHIHYGGTGQNGIIAIPLTSVGSLVTGAGMMPNDSAYRLLLSGKLYFNIHTSSHSGGELRSQLEGPRFYPFWSEMTGAQAVPSNSSTGEGIFLMRYDALNNKLQFVSQILGLNNVSAAHIHAGAIGTNGNPMVTLSYNTSGYAEEEDNNNITLADSTLRLISKLETYVNVHTSSFPNGEIRGQIYPAYYPTGLATLDGANQVPSNNSQGRGIFAFDIENDNDVYYTFLVNGLSGTSTAAHIHAGEKGQNGSPIYPLTFGLEEKISDVPDSIKIQLLRGGKHYVNVHTSAFPDGEIRGELFPIDDSGGGPNTIRMLNEGIIPQKYALDQNYPNPFNPSTIITYHLPVAADVTLKVFDVIGRETAVLINAHQDAGSYSVRFNASSVSSGLYFYQLQAGPVLLTKKMLLVR
jgi:hypothetical protein